MNVPDLRPKCAAADFAPMESSASHQNTHLHPALAAMVPLDSNGEPLAKVLPAGEPLVSTCWTCPACDFTKRGGPPAECQAWMLPNNCPLNQK